jgi:DNA-directed RNA polymerase subunit beta'
MQFMSGYNPQASKVPFVYQKFVNQLRAAGVNVVKQGTQTNIMALTDKDIDELAGDRELTSAEGVDWNKQLKELPNGLFDKAKTGGHGGNRWSFIRLHEPMPSPVMEEPIRRMLGLTQKQFQGVLSGTENLNKYGTGPTAIKKALGGINIDTEIEKTRNIIAAGRASERDAAVRKLGYLKSCQKLKLKPEDYMLTKVPVLPPMFRPVSMMSNDMPLINDANYLYKELFEANKNLKSIQAELGADGSGQERLATYNAFKAVTGLGDPISQKTRDKKVKGVLQSVFGTSPKFGTLQRKLISTTVDNVGRAVITPNPDLDMDSVGLPEEKAFKAYEKFVTRRLVRQGMSMRVAREHVVNKTDLARKILLEEMDHRPVYISRAPVLHKFGIMAMKPRLTKGDTLQVSPLIVKGFNADFDGDAMNYHVPSTEKARQEALERLLPSRNLFSLSDFKSVMHAPANEYVGGLYHATNSNSERPRKIFRTVQDMRRAYERGDISIDDKVQILES